MGLKQTSAHHELQNRSSLALFRLAWQERLPAGSKPAATEGLNVDRKENECTEMDEDELSN